MALLEPLINSNNSRNFAIWAYQDFAAGIIDNTSVILTANQNGIGSIFNSNNIISGRGYICQASDSESYIYTGTEKLFSTKVKITSQTGNNITLSGVPNIIWGDIRIWYQLKSSFFPREYTLPPLTVSARMLDKLDPIIVTPDEIIDNLLSNDAKKVLSANQGRVLKELIDQTANITVGYVELINGYARVDTTAINYGDVIVLNRIYTSVNAGIVQATCRGDGAFFTIESNNEDDNSIFNWAIIKNNALSPLLLLDDGGKLLLDDGGKLVISS